MTMVELVVALLLGGSVLLGLGYVFALTTGQWVRGQAKVMLQADGSRALDEISRAAGHAGEFSAGKEGELILSYPASPMEPRGTGRIAFFLRDQILFRDGQQVVPVSGDTSMGVAGFSAEPERHGGAEVLRIRLKLFARASRGAAADTMDFETLAYPRNRGLGLKAGTGAVGSGSVAARAGMGAASGGATAGTGYSFR